jgi:hypothetical protein
METLKKILSYDVGLLFPSYFTLVGIWILSLSFFCVYLVFFTLSIFQIQSIITGTAKTSDTSAFVYHICDVGSLKTISKLYKSSKTYNKELDSLSGIPGNMQLKCIPNPPREVEYYTVSEMCTGKECNNKALDAEIDEGTKEKDDFEQKMNREADKLSKEYRENNGNFQNAIKKLSALNDQKIKLEQETQNVREVIDNLELYDILFRPISALLSIKDVWRIPSFIMAIWLSLAMGALGSLVFITIQYLGCDQGKFAKKNVAEYIFRPILGALMALVMYIVIRSGQDSFFLDESVAPSAFIMSFVSVMSGMASESIYKALNKNIKSKLGEE